MILREIRQSQLFLISYHYAIVLDVELGIVRPLLLSCFHHGTTMLITWHNLPWLSKLR